MTGCARGLLNSPAHTPTASAMSSSAWALVPWPLRGRVARQDGIAVWALPLDLANAAQRVDIAATVDQRLIRSDPVRLLSRLRCLRLRGATGVSQNAARAISLPRLAQPILGRGCDDRNGVDPSAVAARRLSSASQNPKPSSDQRHLARAQFLLVVAEGVQAHWCAPGSDRARTVVRPMRDYPVDPSDRGGRSDRYRSRGTPPHTVQGQDSAATPRHPC